MKYIYIILLYLIIGLINYAQIPSGYYNNALNKNGYILKTALYNIIKAHDEQSYNSLWTHFQKTDKKSNGKVWDMYSDNPNGTPPYEFTFISDQCGNYTGESSCYNREHSFPKSWFNDILPMNTDLFHLYPTDGFVNGKRSNYIFAEVKTASWTSLNGSKLGSSATIGYSGSAPVFEPIDAYKGDFARTYFYMATRYENVIASWQKNEANGDIILNGTANQVYEKWYIDMLIKWHNADPVSTKELNRNNAIYTIQTNRNPFIDHPEYINAIWGSSTAINDLKVETRFTIYPNPATSEFTVTLLETSTNFNRIEIVNGMGQTVKIIAMDNNSQMIEVGDLPRGVYMVILRGENVVPGLLKLILK
jgi:endonuclease I